MFKRRKDESVTSGDGAAPEPPAAVPAALFNPPRPEAAPPASPVGVPPFRASSAPNKEVPVMARPPFNPSTPSGPSGPYPGSTGMAPRPGTQAGSPQPAVATQPNPAGPPPGVLPGQPVPPARAQVDHRVLVVGRGISLKGVIQDAERLVVEGNVEAQLLHATELAVSAGGTFKGEVEVEDAEIAGTMDGSVTARGSLVVRGTGRVIGTARCRRLQVEDGGQISGNIEMITDPPAVRVIG